MSLSRLVALALLWALCLAAIGRASAGEQPAVADLIRQAGNAEEDGARLEILKKLQQVAQTDERLRRDVDQMVAAVQRWTDVRNLTYFGGEVGRTVDFEFHVAADSPLYPLTCLYRGRMLTWTTLENGNIIRYEDRRRKFLDKAVENFRQAQAAFPENRIIRMYLGEPIPSERTYPAFERAPEWARWQRENLERLADIIVWWIDHRLQPDGQYGGGWGDDCEMWRWWSPVLIGFDDPQIAAAQARFSTALLNQPHLKRGYTTTMTDVEHSAEDSSDAITPLMHLEPQDPAWQKRALRLAEFMEQLWTGRNERGQLQFKSTYFTAERVDARPERACDTVYHPRAVQPVLLFWQRTADKRLEKLIAGWMDTWVDAAARAERGKPAGVVPSAIHWPDGRVGGLGEHWWDPRNHGEPTLYEWPSALSMLNDTLLLTYHMTGEEKYLQPLRSMAAIRRKYLEHPPGAPPLPGSEAWCAAKLGLLAGTLAKLRALTGRTEFDDLLARDYGGRLLSGSGKDRSAWVQRLRDSAAALGLNFPGFTSEVRWTDRVLRFPALFGENMMFREAVRGIRTPDPELLYSLATGDPGSAGYFPLNAVRWHTPPREIAALVTESGNDRFAAELYHFGEQPRPMSADLYLLARGRYTLTIAARPPSGGPERSLQQRDLEVTTPITRIEFELPSRQEILLRVTQ